MDSQSFTIWESHLPGKLGLSRDRVRELRKTCLKKGEHWILDKKRVLLTPLGLDKIRTALLLPTIPVSPVPPAPAVDPQKTAPAGSIAAHPDPFPRLFTAHIYRVHFVNKRVIECFRPGTDPLVKANRFMVRVRSSENFVTKRPDGTPFEVPVLQVAENHYTLNRPCPRSRGRW